MQPLHIEIFLFIARDIFGYLIIYINNGWLALYPGITDNLASHEVNQLKFRR